MESTQTQYRLLKIKKQPFHNEKRTFTSTTSKKQPTKLSEGQTPTKASHNYSYKSSQKSREKVKHQNYVPKWNHYPDYKDTGNLYQEAYIPRYQYYPQYYWPSPMGYPELLVPVYGYPPRYVEKPYYDKKVVEEHSPQENGNSSCPTVASEEDLNNLNGEECEMKIVLNGNVIHTGSQREQGSEANGESAVSSSEYEEFVLPLTGNEPKSETISMPTFLQ